MFLVLAPAIAAGCDEANAPPADQDPDRGPLGKADALAGSCVDVCDDQAPEGCWCDTMCSEYGDCCADYEVECVDSDDEAIPVDASDEELRAVAGFSACTGEEASDAVLSAWAESGGVALLSGRRRSCSEGSGCGDWAQADHIPSDAFVLNPAESVSVEPLEGGWRVRLGSLATCIGPADALECETEYSLIDEARAEFSVGRLNLREGCGDLIIRRREFINEDTGWNDSLLAVRAERRTEGSVSERLADQLRTPTPVELHCTRTNYATRHTCSGAWEYSTRGTLDMELRMRGGEFEVTDHHYNVPESLRGILEDDEYSNSSYSWRTTVRAAGDRVEIRYQRDDLDNVPSWCSIRTGYRERCVASFVAMP